LEATALVLLLDNYLHYLLRHLKVGTVKGKHFLPKGRKYFIVCSSS